MDFYTRDHGRVRGSPSRRAGTRSRFGSALELFTLGELVFFDTGRSELVRVDHFDIVHPFVRVREHLERLGRGRGWSSAWRGSRRIAIPQPALFGLTLEACARSTRARGPSGWPAASRCGRWTSSATGRGSTAASSAGAPTRFARPPST